MPCVPCRRCKRLWVAVDMKPEAVINLVVDVNVGGDSSDSQTGDKGNHLINSSSPIESCEGAIDFVVQHGQAIRVLDKLAMEYCGTIVVIALLVQKTRLSRRRNTNRW